MRRFTAAFLLTVSMASILNAADGDDTPKAAATRKALKTKITVDFADTKLADALEELKEQAKGLSFLIDTKGGVSRNQTLTYKGKDVTVEEALDGMLKKNGLGYVVMKSKAYDGSIQIKQGKERGYEAGKEPKDSTSKDKKDK